MVKQRIEKGREGYGLPADPAGRMDKPGVKLKQGSATLATD